MSDRCSSYAYRTGLALKLDRRQNPERELVKTFLPAVLLAVAAFLVAYQFVDPAPPDRLVMATGNEQGAYYLFAQKIRHELARHGIELQVRATSGSIENLQQLVRGEAEVAFVQGGTGSDFQAADLESLGSLFFEPLWVLYRGNAPLRRVGQLRGKRLALGAERSGTRALALTLLRDNEIAPAAVPLGDTEAAAALERGELDAMFLVASEQSPLLHRMLLNPGVHTMDFERAAAYTRRHDFLSKVTLPQGTVDLARNIPQRDTALLAAAANLVARPDLHPALVDLLLQAAQAVVGKRGWFEQSGQFPAPEFLEFPIDRDAQRFYRYGPPFLQRVLPFWAATLVDRMKVMLVPLLALLIPLVKLMPPVYRWRMRARVFRWYRQLRSVDLAARKARRGEDYAGLLSELAHLEQDVNQVSVPLSFADELYDLQLHLSLVRERLERSRAAAEAGAPPA